MYARLSIGFGWTYEDDQGNRRPVVLVDVKRYAGMVEGKAVHDGRMWARPLGEFDALSLDGETWLPFWQLRGEVVWRDADGVHEPVVPLRVA